MVLKKPSMIFLLAVTFIGIVVFLITYFARITYAGSDSRYSLLVSQSILENGDIKLDAYAERGGLSAEQQRFIEHNGHLYYYFPIGTSLIMLPAVWLANSFGFDFVETNDDYFFQNLLSAITSTLIFFVLFLISRIFLGNGWGLLVSTITMLGSGFVSTLGAALWNLNLATLFILISLLFLILLTKKTEAQWVDYALGISLFAAFISRPTTAIFIACALSYLLIWYRQSFVRAAATALMLLSGWLVFNFLEFGQFLPPYYSLSRLQPVDNPLLVAIYGQLFSPSRGVFIFSPFLLLVIVGILFDLKSYRHERLFYFSIVWFSLHVISVSIGGSVPWWGGHSFGPRLLVDAIPALFLLSLLFFQRVIGNQYGKRTRNIILLIYVMLGGIGFLINSVQGLYNNNTARWNGAGLPPDPGLQNEYLFDWRYPQFLATKSSICARNRSLAQAWLQTHDSSLDPYVFGELISYSTIRPRALFVGLSKPEPGWRWVECADSEINFGPISNGSGETLNLNFVYSTPTVQTLTVSINDTIIGNIDITHPSDQPQHFNIPLDPTLLNESGNNRLKINAPG